MKKVFSLILLVVFLSVQNACFALSELYYIKNANKSVMDNKIESLFAQNDYIFKNKSPFYAILNKDNSKYAVAVLQQSGANLFYYYTTNHSAKKVHNTFLKDLKNQNIVYEQSFNTDLLNNFDKIAQKTLTGTKTVYSFENNVSASTPVQQAQNQINKNALSGYVATVGKGVKLDTYLQTPINTATANVGDEIQAVLKTDWIYNNMVIAPQGSVVFGNLTKARHASIGLRNGSVSINFTKIVTPDNISYNLVTQPVDFDVSNEGIVTKTLTSAIAPALIGALLGLAIGAASRDSGSIAKGVLIGAGVGAGGALVNSAVQSGVDAEIPSFTDLEIVIEKDIRVMFNY